MTGEREADVVIVGAALAGLVAGAILTRHGKRVVLLDQADTVGGRGGAVERPGGWGIDFGHRDGHDVGDCRSEEHTSELQSLAYLVCRLLLEKKKKRQKSKL